jgi:hypothetical protein
MDAIDELEAEIKENTLTLDKLIDSYLRNDVQIDTLKKYLVALLSVDAKLDILLGPSQSNSKQIIIDYLAEK